MCHANPLIMFIHEELDKNSFTVTFDMASSSCVVYDDRITEYTAGMEVISLGDNPDAILSRGFVIDTHDGYMTVHADIDGSSKGVTMKLTN